MSCVTLLSAVLLLSDCAVATACTPDYRGIGWCEYGASDCLIPTWRKSATDILQCTNPTSKSVPHEAVTGY
jgi:hypothetical protein